MIDSKKQATVMFKLTEQEAATLLVALQECIPAMIKAHAEPSPLAKRLEKDFKTMRAINKANAKGWK
mgnify:CR=1 FL=1|jgi:hypothetical protein